MTRTLAQGGDQFGSWWPSINPPQVTSPQDGATGLSVVLSLLLTATPFSVDGADTQASADWEIRTAPDGGGTVAWSSYGDTGNLLTKLVPALSLQLGKDYYIRTRQNGATLGVGVWSPDAHIRT